MAKRGDVQRAVLEGARVIILIDGEMLSDYGPSVDEVRCAVAGVPVVIGAASLGALRAAELCSMGMLGIGWVFKQFASGRLHHDTDLLCAVMPRSGRPITLPLVNVLYALKALLREGRISFAQSDRIERALRRIPFHERERELVLRVAAEEGVESGAATFLVAEETNVKVIDTKLCFELTEKLLTL